MLDLSSISVVDNHCHPILLQQQMDALQFRGYLTEATHPSFAQKHMPNTVYYLWMIRQMAAFYGCAAVEEEVLAARQQLSSDELVQRLFASVSVDTLIFDKAFPDEASCYSPERTGELAGCRVARMLRLEISMQRLILDYSDFDEVIERLRDEVRQARRQGYCSLKSIVAYRTGLNIQEWSKDEAAKSFAEARELAVRQGALRIMQKPLLDYLLHVAFAQAAEQHLPIQFHTGYGDSDTDMRLGNPLQLRDVLERRDYQTMPIVLLHESYPYTQLSAYLAAVYPHVYFDLSYANPFIDRLEMLAFTRQALSVAPASKLLYSSDGIHVPEIHWASARRVHSILGQVLQEMIDADELDEQQAYRLANYLLRDTAYEVYQLSSSDAYTP